jgi:hypothetical protein
MERLLGMHLEDVSEVGVVVLGHTAHTSIGSSLDVGRAVLPVSLDVGSVHVKTEETVADELASVGAEPNEREKKGFDRQLESMTNGKRKMLTSRKRRIGRWASPRGTRRGVPRCCQRSSR